MADGWGGQGAGTKGTHGTVALHTHGLGRGSHIQQPGPPQRFSPPSPKGLSLLLSVSVGKSEGLSLLETAHQGVRACLGAGQHPLQAQGSCPLCLAGDRAAPGPHLSVGTKDSEVKAGDRHS